VTEGGCPFCSPEPDCVFHRDPLVIGLWDRFPVTPGHALLVTVRHVPTWFEASTLERVALLSAIENARTAIESRFRPDGYNIGINNGEAAGQTVPHLHLHIIPRKHGDVADPRGGVRYVLPHKANYVSDADALPYGASRSRAYHSTLITGGNDDPLLPELKHHLAASKAADFAVAFTLRSGLELIHPHMQDLLDREGSLRIVTGDYLDTTDPDALLRLLDLSGRIECRVFETNVEVSGAGVSNVFHPKAYLFHHRDGSGAAFVGSSNLSASALTTGIEWNYRVLESRDSSGWDELKRAFEALFASPNTVPLTPEWVERYRIRRVPKAPVSVSELRIEPEIEIPTPHSVQEEALAALTKTRIDGRRAGLVVLATGLGKTWLSAFDSKGFRRVLFVAHRDEILGQALANYRVIRPHDSLGRYTGAEKVPTAAVLFASIQTLSRQVHLDRFGREQFDYIVVDEFHHAEARTYRRLIDYFRPKFLLGLTATPERTDGADLLALCDNNLVYRCDLTEGIRRGLLCPFRYFGVPDTVDYRNIPWRNKKFDENELTKAVATQVRAANALDQYRKRAGRGTLAFCVSQRHADFMAEYLTEHGVSAKAVHAGSTSAPRAESLEELQDGTLSVLCAVDIFNEGVDVPALDTVMMLRPTESRIVWLQQFGRGLRFSEPTKRLTVIDYIGNHRSFLLKPQALFGLPGGDREVFNLLERVEAGTQELPPGCEVTYELESKNILRALLRTAGSAAELLTRRYQDFRDTMGVRPTAVEMFREGYNPRIMRPQFGSWLAFVKSQAGLSKEEERALDQARDFLDAVETTSMTRSYKMLVLLALLNRGQFPGSLGLSDLAAEVEAIARNNPRVQADTGEVLGDAAKLAILLRENPIQAWIEGKGTGGVSYFSYDGDVFSTRIPLVRDATAAAQELVREVVDWRLAEYFTRPGHTMEGELALKVSHADGRPIIFLADRDSHPELPEGWTDIRVDGETLSANFARVAINVVRRSGGAENLLPGLLHRWFGPDAGKPGTRHQVMLRQEEGSWLLRPVGARAVGAIPYKAYRRSDIAPLFDLRYSERYWGQGFVRQGNQTFLFVTLDKTGHAEGFQYKDHFLSASSFQWQSQNRTTQESDAGRSIQRHTLQGIVVHLFVRAKAKTPAGTGAPFYYCGPVDYVSWTGEKPITVVWKLTTPVPPTLWKELGIPQSQ